MFLHKEKSGFHKIYYTNPKTGKITKKSTRTKNSSEAIKVFNAFKKEKEEMTTSEIKSISITEFGAKYRKYKEMYCDKDYAQTSETLLKAFDKFLNYSKTLNQIQIKDVFDFINELMTKQAPYSVKIYNTILGTAFKWASENKYLAENFKTPKVRIKIPKKEKVFLFKEDFIKLVSFIKKTDVKDIVIMAFMTGMRRGELIDLTWGDVFIERRMISLANRTSLTKSREMRTIPLQIDSISILKERYLKRSGNYVFTSNNEKWHPSMLSWEFNQAVVRAFGKNSKITFHTLRHSYASNLVLQGADIFVVKLLLGHSSVTTTEIYTHLQTNKMQGLVEGLSIKEDAPITN